MENTNLNNLITKDDIKDIKDAIKKQGGSLEEKWNVDLKLLSEIVATKEDLKGLATKEDLKGMASKEDLENLKVELADKIENAKTGLASEIVTKDYLDKKLHELEEKIVARILREKSKLKEALILVMGILRKGKRPTKEEVETLMLLEQELSV